MPYALIVDDDREARLRLAELIAEEGFTTDTASDVREAKIMLGRKVPQVLITDLQLPDSSGLELLGSVARHLTETIIITGYACVDTVLSAWRCGATDYLVKPVCAERLKGILQRIRASSDDKTAGSARGLARMIGRSPAMLDVQDQLTRVAPTDATVMLIGESGTGKELAARAVHELSTRRNGPFIAINCGAISPNLIESEMFGHERGSFTGADRQRQGYFERANGGTLFLDEITEMPLELQVKLLRVLETSRFMRVGTNTEISTDVRIVAATNRDPKAAVAKGQLRPDLYHRLNVFPVRLPPLRDRGNDVRLLAQSYLDALNEKHGTVRRFPASALDAIDTYVWPGNVRELRNYVYRAYIMSGSDTETACVPLQALAGTPEANRTVRVPIGTPLSEVDRQVIYATLDHCGGVKKLAADILGISLKTLYNRLESYSIDVGGLTDGERACA